MSDVLFGLFFCWQMLHFLFLLLLFCFFPNCPDILHPSVFGWVCFVSVSLPAPIVASIVKSLVSRLELAQFRLYQKVIFNKGILACLCVIELCLAPCQVVESHMVLPNCIMLCSGNVSLSRRTPHNQISSNV